MSHATLAANEHAVISVHNLGLFEQLTTLANGPRTLVYDHDVSGAFGMTTLLESRGEVKQTS